MELIGVFRESESGERLAAFEDGGIDSRLLDRATATGLLRFADPYGDLVINQLQLPVLVEELRQIGAESYEADLQPHIERLIRFLEESQGVHLYVRFFGTRWQANSVLSLAVEPVPVLQDAIHFLVQRLPSCVR